MPARRSAWMFVLVSLVAGIVVLVAALNLRAPRARPSMPTVLVWDVPENLVEDQVPRRPFSFGWPHRAAPTVLGAVRALDRAARDPKVRALVLHIDDVDWGWGKLSEIRDAVSRVRAEGKTVYATLASGGDAEYFLASAANRVAMPPAAVLYVDGLSATATFARGTLDLLDIHPNFVQAGTYKSGTEFFTRREFSAPAREALEALVDDTFGMLVDSVASARALPRDSVLRLVDLGPFTPAQARGAGLVDTIARAEEIDSLALRRAGARGLEITPFPHYRDRSGPRGGSGLAYVCATGTIAFGRSRVLPGEERVLGAETLARALRDVRERGSIKAVVLRIDSPGGDAQATDEIWREVKLLSAKKPVIVSFSDVAASGGYYLAAPATRIVAQPSTLTGSIGVFAGKLNVLGLYRKLGLSVETVSRGKHAEMMSPFRDFSDEEAGRFQELIDTTYRLFLSRVAEGRRLPLAEVEASAGGRVWTGSAALQRSLVDTLGSIRTACRLALKSAGLPTNDPFWVDEYPRIERTFLDRVFEDWVTEESDDEETSLRGLAPLLAAWRTAAEFPAGRGLALLPWSIEIR